MPVCRAQAMGTPTSMPSLYQWQDFVQRPRNAEPDPAMQQDADQKRAPGGDRRVWRAGPRERRILGWR